MKKLGLPKTKMGPPPKRKSPSPGSSPLLEEKNVSPSFLSDIKKIRRSGNEASSPTLAQMLAERRGKEQVFTNQDDVPSSVLNVNDIPDYDSEAGTDSDDSNSEADFAIETYARQSQFNARATRRATLVQSTMLGMLENARQSETNKSASVLKKLENQSVHFSQVNNDGTSNIPTAPSDPLMGTSSTSMNRRQSVMQRRQSVVMARKSMMMQNNAIGRSSTIQEFIKGVADDDSASLNGAAPINQTLSARLLSEPEKTDHAESMVNVASKSNEETFAATVAPSNNNELLSIEKTASTVRQMLSSPKKKKQGQGYDVVDDSVKREVRHAVQLRVAKRLGSQPQTLPLRTLWRDAPPVGTAKRGSSKLVLSPQQANATGANGGKWKQKNLSNNGNTTVDLMSTKDSLAFNYGLGNEENFLLGGGRRPGEMEVRPGGNLAIHNDYTGTFKTIGVVRGAKLEEGVTALTIFTEIGASSNKGTYSVGLQIGKGVFMFVPGKNSDNFHFEVVRDVPVIAKDEDESANRSNGGGGGGTLGERLGLRVTELSSSHFSKSLINDVHDQSINAFNTAAGLALDDDEEEEEDVNGATAGSSPNNKSSIARQKGLSMNEIKSAARSVALSSREDMGFQPCDERMGKVVMHQLRIVLRTDGKVKFNLVDPSSGRRYAFSANVPQSTDVFFETQSASPHASPSRRPVSPTGEGKSRESFEFSSPHYVTGNIGLRRYNPPRVQPLSPSKKSINGNLDSSNNGKGLVSSGPNGLPLSPNYGVSSNNVKSKLLNADQVQESEIDKQIALCDMAARATAYFADLRIYPGEWTSESSALEAAERAQGRSRIGMDVVSGVGGGLLRSGRAGIDSVINGMTVHSLESKVLLSGSPFVPPASSTAAAAMQSGSMGWLTSVSSVLRNRLGSAFDLFDVDQDGYVDYEECIQVLQACGFELVKKERDDILKRIDAGGRGKVRLYEIGLELGNLLVHQAKVNCPSGTGSSQSTSPTHRGRRAAEAGGKNRLHAALKSLGRETFVNAQGVKLGMSIGGGLGSEGGHNLDWLRLKDLLVTMKDVLSLEEVEEIERDMEEIGQVFVRSAGVHANGMNAAGNKSGLVNIDKFTCFLQEGSALLGGNRKVTSVGVGALV